MVKSIQSRGGFGLTNKIMCFVGSHEDKRPVAFGILLVVGICIIITELHVLRIVNSQPAGVYLPISTNTSDYPCSVSPFCLIESKMFFMSTLDSYFYKPLAKAATRTFQLDLVVSADTVSYSQVVIALFCYNFVSSDSLLMRRIGCLFYLFRDFLDLLDGAIAKHAHIGHNGSSVKPVITFGYLIDGVCDGLAVTLLVLASIYHLQRVPYQRRSQNNNLARSSDGLPRYTQLLETNIAENTPSGGNRKDEDCQYRFLPRWIPELYRKVVFRCSSRFKHISSGRSVVLLLPQLLISSIFWNRNIILFGKLLEPVSPNALEVERASMLIHSPIMWTIFYAWKMFNPLSICDVLVVCVFLDMIPDFYRFSNHSIFIIGLIAILSEAYRYNIL